MKGIHGSQLRSRIVLIAVVLATFVSLVSAERATSHTVDEPGHLVRGVAWWWAEDTRLSWPHPPLGQLVAAAPVAAFAEPIEIEALRGWDDASFTRLTHDYFRRFSSARHQLRIARVAMGALSLLLLVYLYEWTRRRYGTRLASITAILYAANPVLLAHAGLMTTDFPIAAVTLVALLQLHDYLLSKSEGRMVALVLAVGALVVTKHTGIVISLLLFPPAVLFAVRRKGRFEGMTHRQGVRRLARDAGLAVLVALLCVNAAYKFEETWLSSEEIIAHSEPPSWLGRNILTEDDFLPEGMRFPIPFNYLFGAEFIRTQNARGHGGYFMGMETKHGFPGYFPILLGIKLPTGLLLLLAAGFAVAARQKFARLPLDVWLHGYFVIAFLLLTFNAQVNIGVRHALPVVPSLVCLAARGANALWDRLPWGRVAAFTGVGSAVVGTLLAYPDYIADFNWLVAGRAGGHWVSVIGEDWGQDVRRLARWQQENDAPLSYYTGHRMRHAELSYWGGSAKKLRCREAAEPGHWVAVHLTERVRRSRCIRAYLDREPDVVLNDHILLYEPERP